MTSGNGDAMWTITSVTDTVMYSPSTGSVHAKRVTYRLWDGTSSYVELPLSEYNAQAVQDKVHEAALKHHQVTGLNGPPVSDNPPQTTPQVPDLMT